MAQCEDNINMNLMAQCEQKTNPDLMMQCDQTPNPDSMMQCDDSVQNDTVQRHIALPLTKEIAETLHMGENVYLSGVIYTARDAAHERMIDQLAEGIHIPFDPKDAVIYYVGPSPARPGTVIGSAGPTTAGRMDKWAPQMIRMGARGMIGKGARSRDVIEAIREHTGVYFGAIGGAGALLAKCITGCELVAYEDLGPEAICRLTVKDFPVTVLIDCEGNNLYESGREKYLEERKS